MFPVTYKNRFVYKVQAHPSWTTNRLREFLAQGLAREGARQITVDDMVIRFNGDPWHWGIRWHFFHAISKGKIAVNYQGERVGVVYQISFIDRFALFLVLIGFVGVMSFVLPGSPFWLSLRYFVMALFWFGLFVGGGIAFHWYRFNRFMQQQLQEFFSSTDHFGVQSKLITSR